MRYMLLVFARAEQAMVEMTIVNINTSLGYYAALQIIESDGNNLNVVPGLNPFNYIQSKQDKYTRTEAPFTMTRNLHLPALTGAPTNYLGEFFDPNPVEIAPGNWYYDLNDQTLNYRVRNTEFYYSNDSGIPMIKYRVVFDYNDINGNERFDAGIDQITGLKLVNLTNYSWTKKQ